MDSATPNRASALVPVLSLCLILVAAIAGYFGFKYSQSQETVAGLTSQLEDSQKEISELQPLADKARTLPVRLSINRHALNAGYNVLAFNLSRQSLRFEFTVNGSKHFNTVIDGGRFFIVKALASGDMLTVASDGYDPKTVTIQ